MEAYSTMENLQPWASTQRLMNHLGQRFVSCPCRAADPRSWPRALHLQPYSHR